MQSKEPLAHRFLFFPLGTESEITVLPFLDLESSAVVLLPPLFYEVIKKQFEGIDVIVDNKRVILFIINDCVFNEIITSPNVCQEIISCTENDFASIWFIGIEDKLVILAEYFRDFCSKKEQLYFHSPQEGDTAYTISKRYKSPGTYAYKLSIVGKEHFVGKN